MKGITIADNQLRNTQIGQPVKSEQNTQMQVTGIEKEKKPEVAVSISEVGKLKAANRTEKKKGASGVREEWENDCVQRKVDVRRDCYGHIDLDETFRLDEPETYAEYLNIELAGLISDEPVYANTHIFSNWFNRRCMIPGYFKNPVTGAFSAISAMESYLSDDKHDTTISVYDEYNKDTSNSIWRYESSKFNVAISQGMLKILKELPDYESQTQEEKQKSRQTVNRIKSAVDEIKEVEKEYEGDFRFLRFGVKLLDDGRITYHANYTGCDNPDGITADSTDELLKQLMTA